MDLTRSGDQYGVSLAAAAPRGSLSGMWSRRLVIPAWVGAVLAGTASLLVLSLIVDALDDAFPASNQGIGLIFIVPVLLASTIGGAYPGVAMAFAAAIVWNWFFIAPYHSLGFTTPQHAIAQISFLLVALVVGWLSQTLRRRAGIAERQSRELSSMFAIGQTVASSLDLNEVVRLILDAAGLVINSQEAVALFADGEALRVVERRQRDRAVEIVSPSIALNPELESMKGPVLVSDAWTDKRTIPRGLCGLCRHRRSWLIAPLVARGGLVGMLCLGHEDAGHFDRADLLLAETFAYQAAIAIDHASLYTEAQGVAIAGERARMAQELHDSVAQSLYGVTLHAYAARRALDLGQSETANDSLSLLADGARSALQEMRLLLFETSPYELRSGGLAAALRVRLEAVERQIPGMRVVAEVQSSPELPPLVEETLYRIGQESLNNALKHSGATLLTVQLISNAATTRLSVSDNGRGFEQVGRERNSGGLAIMAARAESAGCDFRVTSQPGAGATVEVSYPPALL